LQVWPFGFITPANPADVLACGKLSAEPDTVADLRHHLSRLACAAIRRLVELGLKAKK
jgi:hypothetical protein